ncbi:MAG: tape measure protein [Halomonas sp.]|uniref:tape measure protein n=1 Tax=Halomonas sp. TaxID=1486246 RepID=UPI003F8F855F
MANNLTLSVTLTGDNRQLSGTLKDAQGDVREFSTTTERESKKAESALTAPSRSAETVSEHLRTTQREARAFGTEATQGGREATQALSQTGQQAQTTTSHFSSLRTMVGLALGAFSIRHVAGFADGWSDMQSVVGAAIGDMSEAGDMMRRITDIANASYAPLELTARTYASNVSALRDLGRTAEETADYTESLNHMLVLTATRGQQAESVQNALSRAMAVGKLQADGLETVLANGGEVAQALANQLGVTVSQLRGLATEGRITGDVIASSLIGSLDDVRDRAGEMPATIEDGFVRISTSATRLVGELDQALGTSEGVAGILISAADMMTAAIDPLVDNIDTLTTGAEIMAVLVGGRVAVALTTATTAMVAKTLATQADVRAEAAAAVAVTRRTAAEKQTALALLSTARLEAQATKGTAAHTFALQQLSVARTRATTAAGAHTAAMNTATAATARASVAARGLSGALALVGGPLGLLVGAGGLLYAFREELGLVRAAAEPTTQRIDDLTNAISQNSVAAVEAGIVSLATEYFALGQQAASATAEIERLTQAQDNDRQGAQARLQNNMRLRDMREELAQVTTEQDAAGESIGKLRETLAGLGQTVVETTSSTTELGDASKTAAAHAKELAKSTEAQATALEALRNRLIPGRREVTQLAQDMQTLTLAIAMGTGNIAQNIQMMGLLQQQYIEAQKDTDDLADKTVKAAFTMEGAWDEVRLNGLRRLDDGFADLWESAIDGSMDAGELMKKALIQTLAEMAHIAVTRPITVQLATSMGFGGMGVQAGGAGGFNLGSLKGGWDAVSGLWGGGSAASTAAAGYGAAGWAGSATGAYGGWAGSAAAGAAQAGTGFMGAASAAAPWLAGGLLVDNVLGLGIVDGITKAISGLFGGGKTPFYGEVGSGSGIKAYRTETALGETGFTQRQRIEKATSAGTQEWAAELFEASKALDTVIASTARSTSELDAMKNAVNSFKVASGDASKLVQAQLVDRTLVALEAAGHDVTAAWGNLGAEELAARIEQASGAMSVMSASSERLNLHFDAASSSALRAADNLAQYAGGVQNLAALQDQYYQAFFSEAERAANLQDDLTQSLNAMGLVLPQNVASYRALVEAQNLNTESGQRNYVQLLQLSSGFTQLQDMLGSTATGVRDFTAELSAARDAVSSAEDQVRRAYEVFSNQAFGQQIELLNLMGDSSGALALERERELATIDEALRPTQERIWAIQDEIAAQQNATAAARNYQRELTRVRDQLSQQFANIGNWLDQQQATSGTPEINLATAQEQLAKQLVLAENGDRHALQNITQYAQQVLDANQAYNASSDAGQRIQQDVFDAIAGLPAAISAEQFLADEIRQALQDAVGQLPGGIATSLHPLFDSIDLDASGLIDWNEFHSAFQGMASDDELRRIFEKLDADGSGTISRLEALNRSNEGTEANTDSLEKQARDQLKELNGLVSEMTRTTDQFVSLNTTMLSLRDAIIALGVAQDDITRIEEERAAAEQAERDRISNERTVSQYTAAANSHMAQSVDAIGRAQRGVDAVGMGSQEISEISKLIERYAGDDGLLQSSEYGALRDTVESMDPGHYRGVARTLALAARHASQAAFNERDAANVGLSGDDRVDAQGVNFWELWQEHLRFQSVDGSHRNGLEYVPFDGYMAELHRGEKVLTAEDAGAMRNVSRPPPPPMPAPNLPLLSNSDVVETLRDLKRENQQLRADLSRLLERISDNTKGTANAVASSAQVAERQRQAQLDEQRAATRASRIRGRVL